MMLAGRKRKLAEPKWKTEEEEEEEDEVEEEEKEEEEEEEEGSGDKGVKVSECQNANRFILDF